MIGFATECSQNGICAFDQRANGTRCVCDMGFYGRFCSSNVTSTTLAPTMTTSLSTLPPNTTLPQTGGFTTFTTTSSMASCIDYSKGAISVCNGHGTCEMYPPGAPNSGNYCQCQEKYHGTYCEKEYKSKWIAFLLEFFVGWTGAESFYIGDIVAGVFKLLLGVLGCCGGICAAIIFFCSKGESTGLAVGCGVFICLSLTAISLWVLINWIMILADAVKDSQGNPLYNGFK